MRELSTAKMHFEIDSDWFYKYVRRALSAALDISVGKIWDVGEV